MEPVVVVDGSNVIHASAGSRRFFSVARVKNVIGKLSKLGYTYKIGMKGKTYKYIMYHADEDEISDADKAALEKLVNDLEVSLLDAEQDDRWIHLAAIEFDGYILSHDQFRDEIEQWEEEGRHDIVEEIKKQAWNCNFLKTHLSSICHLSPVRNPALTPHQTPRRTTSLLILRVSPMNQERTWTYGENRFQKKRSKRPLLNLMCLLRTLLKRPMCRCCFGSKRVVGMRFNCHLTPHLVGFFFAECVELTSESASILEKFLENTSS